MDEEISVWDQHPNLDLDLRTRAKALERVAAAAQEYRRVAPLKDPDNERNLIDYVHAMEGLDAALKALRENSLT